MWVKSDRIYTEDGLCGGYLSVQEGRFAGVSDTADGEYEDYGNLRILPGIFDTHNHGTQGYSLLGDAGEDPMVHVRGFLKGCAAQGVTSVFPTAEENMIASVARAAKEPIMGAEIVGIHSEGPWLNRTGEKGIWVPWPEVSLERAKQIVSDADGLLKLVALAPEIEGIDPIIEYFLSQGIAIAYAHSDLNYEGATRAYKEKGLSVATHTGNVMTGMHHRDIGGLGASLLGDGVYCEVICDGMHICLDMLRVYFKLKDPSQFMMVSDCTPFSGAPAGTYPDVFMGFTITVTPEGFVLSETGRLLGSSQPVIYGMGNLVEKLHMPMETVSRMASLNPCRKYGIDDVKGSISDGKQADFIVITDDYKVVATYVKGVKVYDSKTEPDVFNTRYWEKKFNS